ncbi:MAG: AMP-binding protein [Burkholderiaceae bacterium]
MKAQELILDAIYQHEAGRPGKVLLTQPLGGDKLADYTWGETVEQARRMAAHLQSRGFTSGQIAILSKNCAHFFIAELAVWMAGCTTVAIYPTENASAIRFVLEHSDARLLFVGKLDNWEQQASGVPEGLPCIALPLAPSTKCETWDALIARSAPMAGRPEREPEDLAMIMYTSGSTGQPKGVMLSFGAVSAAAHGIVRDVRQRVGAGEWRVLSYLPLAHSFERAYVESVAWVEGHCHVYFAESLETFIADLNRARPTIFVSVPRLWLKFQQGVFAKVPARKLDRLLGIPLLGKRVGRKVLAGLGLDQTVVAASGSAPIPPPLIAWYRKLGLNLLEGYAMTEDFAYSHRSTEKFNAPGYVGIPFDDVQVRISDAGEILIKSPGQLSGYYKRPDLDAESFTTDGFFRTGDMGERRADGLLKLTGRIKEQFKTAKGNYVAPAPIENLLNQHPMIETAMVSGVGCVAAYGLVVLTEELRPQLADPAVRAEVQAQLGKLLEHVNAALPEYERLHMLVVAREPWSIENGCLTPTMKIKRSRIESAVSAELDAWYARRAPVIWA